MVNFWSRLCPPGLFKGPTRKPAAADWQGLEPLESRRLLAANIALFGGPSFALAINAGDVTPSTTDHECILITSRKGCLAASAFIRTNSGDSSIARRITKLNTPPRPPWMKAIRQPSVGTCSGGSHVRTRRLTPVATATPSVTHENTTPQTNPDRRGEVSTT